VLTYPSFLSWSRFREEGFKLPEDYHMELRILRVVIYPNRSLARMKLRGLRSLLNLNNVFNEIYRYTAENASLKGTKKAASNGCRLPEGTR